MSHQYKFTVESLNNPNESTIEFETQTREDLFKIVEMMKQKSGLDEADSTALAVGLKLFGEVMMLNRDKELFRQIKPHFADFMKTLKGK
jgi:hypothetical protein